MGPLLTYLLTAVGTHLFWLSGRDGQVSKGTVDTFPNPRKRCENSNLGHQTTTAACGGCLKALPNLEHIDRSIKNLNITMSCLRWTCSRYDQHLDFGSKKETFVWNRDMKCDVFGKTWGIYKALHLQILRWMVWYQWCVMPYSVTLLLIHTRYYSSTVNTCCKNEAHYNIVGIRMTSEAKTPSFWIQYWTELACRDL